MTPSDIHLKAGHLVGGGLCMKHTVHSAGKLVWRLNLISFVLDGGLARQTGLCCTGIDMRAEAVGWGHVFVTVRKKSCNQKLLKKKLHIKVLFLPRITHNLWPCTIKILWVLKLGFVGYNSSATLLIPIPYPGRLKINEKEWFFSPKTYPNKNSRVNQNNFEKKHENDRTPKIVNKYFSPLHDE